MDPGDGQVYAFDEHVQLPDTCQNGLVMSSYKQCGENGIWEQYEVGWNHCLDGEQCVVDDSGKASCVPRSLFSFFKRILSSKNPSQLLVGCTERKVRMVSSPDHTGYTLLL